ncbi:MAG: response regulator [Planctomycetota bacterium]|nr:response regulator [Planctomycetota bacterium]
MTTTLLNDPIHRLIPTRQVRPAVPGMNRPEAAGAIHFPSMENRGPRIMLVDDEPINIKVAKKYLANAGFTEFYSTSNAAEALPMIIRNEPDVVLLDIVMPQFSGLDLLAAIRADSQMVHMPVVMLTAVEDRETKCQALELGATDFLSKPVDPSELVSRVRNLLGVKSHFDHMHHYAVELERKVNERTAQLEASHQDVIHCLARAGEFRDDDTGRHVLRVGRYAGVIARQLGWDEDSARRIEQAAQLHDIGKLGIPDAILSKPGKLTAEEFEMMQKHCGFGKSVFETISQREAMKLREHTDLGNHILGACGSPVLDLAAEIALTHHERWDGSGYPIGLAGKDIPISGRITAVADVFDALSTKRCYKPSFPLEKCLTILEEGRGKHFDPEVLDAFFAAREQILKVQILLAEVD